MGRLFGVRKADLVSAVSSEGFGLVEQEDQLCWDSSDVRTVAALLCVGFCMGRSEQLGQGGLVNSL